MKVTFDSNVWRIVVTPSRFPGEAALQSFQAIRSAIIDSRMKPFLVETVFTLETIQRGDRQQFISDYKPSPTFDELPQPDGSLTVRGVIGPNPSAHPGLNPVIAAHLEDAMNLGFKLLRSPRIRGVQNPGLPATFYLADDPATIQATLAQIAALQRAIEAKGCGMSHLKAIGIRYIRNGHWVDGIAQAPGTESGMISKAIAELADADAIAAHVGYGNDYFCTRDVRASGGPHSVLHPHQRQWLQSTYGIQFVTPEQLGSLVGP